MKHWWDMMDRRVITILPLNVTIKTWQQHRPATGGIWKVNSGKQIKEEDKSLKQDKSGFQFTQVFIFPLPLGPMAGTAKKVCSKSRSQSHTYMAERTFQREPPGTGKFWRCHICSEK